MFVNSLLRAMYINFMSWFGMTDFVLQGSALPRSSLCNTAANNLFDIDDKCSRAVQEYLNNYNNSVISDILVDNCPTRLCEYVNDCNQNNDRVSKQSI